MTRKEPKSRQGCMETHVVKINRAAKEAVGRTFAYGLPRQKRDETGSKSIEPVNVRMQIQARKEGILADSRTGT